MDYRKKITEIRKAKGLNQKQLAAKIFVTPPIICYIEGSKRDTTIGMLQRIADALEVNIKVFFED
jgi:transcriptional regulator with XRE-family HTH domain